MKYGLLTYDFMYKSFDDAFSEKFKDMKFTKFLGAGNNAFALENEDGIVLKMCRFDNFLLRAEKEEFDAKIFEKDV